MRLTGIVFITKLRFDPELLYVAAAFHDFGLIKKFSSPDGRFEVDGANAARQFLIAHKVPEAQIEIAGAAIALHTTPGVTQYTRPEIALLYSGVGLDVLGKGFDQFPSELSEKIVAEYPSKALQGGLHPGVLCRFCAQARHNLRHRELQHL
jgi:hypothetical protein